MMLPQCFEITLKTDGETVAAGLARLVWRGVILYPT